MPKKTVRTTLTLEEPVSKVLQRMAKRRGIPLMSLVREAVKRFVDSELAESTLDIPDSASQQLTAVVGELANPYQQLVASWRQDRTRRQLSSIKGGQVLFEAWPAEVYLINILQELLRSLNQSSEVLTIARPSYWRRFSKKVARFHGPESSNTYLTAELSAITNGTTLSRVFLFDDAESFQSLLERQRRFLANLGPEQRQHVNVRARHFKDREEAKRYSSTFACVRRRVDPETPLTASSDDGGALVIETVDGGDSKMFLRLLFSNGPGNKDAMVRPFLDLYYQSLAGAQSIEDFLKAEKPRDH